MTAWLERLLSYLLLRQAQASSVNFIKCLSEGVTASDMQLHPSKQESCTTLRHQPISRQVNIYMKLPFI